MFVAAVFVVAVTGAPVAPLPAGAGQGLCDAEATSANPAGDFPQSAGTFVAGMNSFLDASTRAERAIATVLDLSNAGGAPSVGDFTTAVGSFAINDTTTAFGTRLRGYLAVTPADLGHEIHVGFYADDAVAFTIFDGDGAAYPVVVRPPQLGFPTWRSTAAVTFAASGLYAIEILHAQIAESAALEVSTYVGTFTDFEAAVGQPGSTNLATAGFALVAPAQLYAAETGDAPAACVQCERQFAGSAGTAGCAAGARCNAAAVCEACTTDAACGATCEPCADPAPLCAPDGAGYACTTAPDAPPIDAAPPPDAETGGEPAPKGCGCRSGDQPGAALVLLVAALLRRRAQAKTSW